MVWWGFRQLQEDSRSDRVRAMAGGHWLGGPEAAWRRAASGHSPASVRASFGERLVLIEDYTVTPPFRASTEHSDKRQSIFRLARGPDVAQTLSHHAGA